MRLGEFSDLVKQKLQIGNPLLIKRTPMKRDQILEVFSQDKQLNELKIIEGNNIYVEDAQTSEVSHKDLNWYKEFETENHSLFIKFNDLNVF